MCGISGLWHYHDGEGHPLETAAIVRATTSLRHRGPNDEGYVLINTRTRATAHCGGRDTDPTWNLPAIERFQSQDFDLALGFRRLSILDLSPAGHQPMRSDDGKCWIVFNGEIYNYLELRDELSHYGYEFQTGTDTEVILAAYRQWGADCLSHFDGMWSFAIWDATARHLFLARDRFGIKPLYYVNDGERFIFASEIKALLSHTHVSRRINPQRLYQYLISGQTDHGEETLFADIYQLPSAHSLTLSARRPQDARPARYWQVDVARELNISFDDATKQLCDLFLSNVNLHLRSDVKVGALLSGGIDSSAIVSSMRILNPQLDFNAFSYVSDDPAVSEERWIDLVGDAVKIAVHKIQPTPEEMIADLDDLIVSQDEPFGSSSIYAQYRLFRLVHENGVKVVLDGQGADELLAGYPAYLTVQMASLLRRGRLDLATRLLIGVSSQPEIGNSNLLYNAGKRLLPANLRRLPKRSFGIRPASEPAWLNMKWFAKQRVKLCSSLNNRIGLSLKEHLHESLVESSVPMLLRYEDRNSMAHSIESRVPFLTASLVEFVLSLPEKHLVNSSGTSKWVFRHAMRGIVPDSILNRQDKIGFVTPESNWLIALRPWMDKVLSSEAARRVPALNLTPMRQEWEDVQRGHRAYDFKIWRWVNLIRWADKLRMDF